MLPGMQHTRQAHGLGSPRFIGYLVAQFLGALNDNAFKMTLVLFGLEHMPDAASEIAFSSLVTALFPLPWLLFSQWAGYLADRYRKDRVLLATKIPELLCMVLGTLAFYAESVPLLLGVFLLLSAQAAAFSPAKYGILPEVMRPEDLAEANGVLSMTTNVAILLGTILGVEMFGVFSPALATAGLIYCGLALLGIAATLYLPVAPPGHPTAVRPLNPLLQLKQDARVLRSVSALAPTVWGISYFSFLGSLLLAVVPVYGTSGLGLPTEFAGRLLVPLTIGLAVGSVLAGRMSRGRVELGLSPLGAIVMALASLHLLLRGTASETFVLGLPLLPVVDLAVMGVGAAFFNVPLTALLQQRSPDAQKGQVIGFSNVTSNLAILVAAACGYGLTLVQGFDVHYTLAALTLVTIAGTVHIVWLLPDFLMRVIMYLLVNALYRLRVVGAQHIPRSGALFVANHVSWVDAVLVAAASGRMVRFMMFRPFYESWPFHTLFRRMHAIPVETGGSREANEASLAQARAEIEAGHTVCIFAEGGITRTGQLLGFKRGLERIMDGLDAPIIPVCLDGLWGSLFSFEGGRVFLKWPRRFRHPIQVLFGEPLAPTATAFDVRRAVQELSVDAGALREREFHTLPVELLRSARRQFWQPLLADASGQSYTYGRAVLAALRVRSELHARGIARGQAVAIRGANDARTVVAHLGVVFAGGVPVHLPALGRESLQEALRAAEVKHELAVDELLAPMNAQSPVQSLLRSLALLALPAPWFARLALGLDPRAVHDPAAVVFSRGTTGPARAIALSHLNALSNLRAFRQVFDVGPEDCVLGVLPLDTAFGFLGTLCLPAYTGARVALAPDPLDATAVARLCQAQRPTLLFAAPALLAHYARELPADAFAALRRVVTGGQVLPGDVANDFQAKFGVEVLEGYGTSEASSLISLNIPDVQIGSTRQQGTQQGSVGHPIPGVAVSVRDPRTQDDLPPDVPGDLWVRGPNVAEGDLGASVAVKDGWHPTGDVACLDRSGFLTLVDRRERLVPHAAGDIPLSRLQDHLRQALGLALDATAPPAFCTTAYRGADGAAAPAVLYTNGLIDPARARAALRAVETPDHWLPRPEAFIRVDALPQHPSGNIDFGRAAELAERQLAPRA